MSRLTPLISGGLFVALAATAVAEVAPEAVQITDMAVATPLTETAGDPAEGRKWFVGRRLGNCLACHENSDAPEEQFHGNVGPAMAGVANRWSPEELRAIVVNSKQVFGEQTIMPAFYRNTGFERPSDKFAGKTILTAQQVEDVVAYLMTLKDE
jgi:sulfur-oxidizing protein SoxX